LDSVTNTFDPRNTVLYQVIADHLETFLATIDADRSSRRLAWIRQGGILRLPEV
jgi:hypothetical protein